MEEDESEKTYSKIPLLVSEIDDTLIDYQLGSVDISTVRYVKTFVPKDNNLAVVEEPLLRIGAGAILNGNCSAGIVRCRCHALGY
jgi:hypothetical protein